MLNTKKGDSMKMKALKNFTLAMVLTSFSLGVTPQARAFDTINLIPALMLGMDTFDKTEMVGDLIVEGDFFTGVAAFVLLMPLALLSDDSKTVKVNAEELSELGYTKSEINEYKKDIQRINERISSRKFASKDEVNQEIRKMNLGIVAHDLLRI